MESAAAAAAAAARENRALLAGLITQEGVALVGILVLAVDPDSALEFEPWGIAAAVLFTWGIVRSEVLTAREVAHRQGARRGDSDGNRGGVGGDMGRDGALFVDGRGWFGGGGGDARARSLWVSSRTSACSRRW